MAVPDQIKRWRHWVPVPTRGFRVHPVRWLLLEGNRLAVTGALLTAVIISIILIGSVWTFKIQQLLTETNAIQTLLNTLLSGIILLVSIVVSISAIVLSYDITSVGSQQERIEESLKLRRRIGRLAGAEQNPTDPGSFMRVMASVINERAKDLKEAAESSDEEQFNDVQEYVRMVTRMVEDLTRTLDRTRGAEFGVLWQGLETEYADYVNRSTEIRTDYRGQLSDTVEERFEDLVEAFELFATGKEYFKTLFYAREISELSRTLLIVSLPTIIATATTILAVNAGLVPNLWMLGLPPMLTFVAITFTVALAPYIVLTSYMLRVATVASRTVTAGPFVLK